MPTLLTTIFGIIPEALFFTIFIIISKDIKEKRCILFICFLMNYYVCKILLHRSFGFYLLYTIVTYGILWSLYRDTEIIDIFLFSTSSLVLMVVSGLCYSILGVFNLNYWMLYAFNRISLFAFLYFFRKQIRSLYLAYRKSWNRAEENKFRSISIRNISFISLNVMMYVLNLSAVYLSTLE